MARPTGPVPKRTEERRRRNKTQVDSAPNTVGQPIDSAPADIDKLGPDAPAWMTGVALAWYESLRTSGQAVFYTDSDWTAAWILGKAIMRFNSRPSAHMLTAILSGFGSLAATEGERRRLRIELERAVPRDPDEDAAVVSMAGYKRSLSGA